MTFHKSRGCPSNGYNTNAGKRLRMINRSISKRDSFQLGDIGGTKVSDTYVIYSYLYNASFMRLIRKVAGYSNRAPWNRGTGTNGRKISVFRLFLTDLYGLSSAISRAERVSVLQTHVLWLRMASHSEIRAGFWISRLISRLRRVTLMLTYLPSQLLVMNLRCHVAITIYMDIF